MYAQYDPGHNTRRSFDLYNSFPRRAAVNRAFWATAKEYTPRDIPAYHDRITVYI